MEIEAAAEVELDIADIATVRVRGGRRDAQDKARALEERWKQVRAASRCRRSNDLDGLDANVGGPGAGCWHEGKGYRTRFPASADKHAYRRSGGVPAGFRPRGDLPSRTR